MPNSTLTLEITGAEAIIKLLGDLEGFEFLNAVAQVAAGDLLKKMTVDMPGAVGATKARPKWVSKGQQRAYLASRREAGLPMKYTRTSDPQSEQLSQGWTVAGLGPGLIGASLGAKATYGPLVMDRDSQTAMHKATGWPTIQDTAEKHGESVVEKIGAAIQAKINAAGGGSAL